MIWRAFRLPARIFMPVEKRQGLWYDFLSHSRQEVLGKAVSLFTQTLQERFGMDLYGLYSLPIR